MQLKAHARRPQAVDVYLQLWARQLERRDGTFLDAYAGNAWQEVAQ